MSSKKDLEAAPLNEQEGYPYDTVFKDRKKKFAQKTVLGEVRTSRLNAVSCGCFKISC